MSLQVVIAYDRDEDAFMCGIGQTKMDAVDNLKDKIWLDARDVARASESKSNSFIREIAESWAIVGSFRIYPTGNPPPKRPIDFTLFDATNERQH